MLCGRGKSFVDIKWDTVMSSQTVEHIQGAAAKREQPFVALKVGCSYITNRAAGQHQPTGLRSMQQNLVHGLLPHIVHARFAAALAALVGRRNNQIKQSKQAGLVQVNHSAHTFVVSCKNSHLFELSLILSEGLDGVVELPVVRQHLPHVLHVRVLDCCQIKKNIII